jgi:uncharacterized membrane protein
MNKNRLEALSDGVLAIILTIMVLELKVPHNPTLKSYLDAFPVFISYALSFIFVGLYWNSHHHLFHKATKVNNKTLLLNMSGLFFVSLIPFSTATMGENAFTSITVTVYSITLVLCVISYMFLVHQLRLLHGVNSEFSTAFKRQFKSYLSIFLNSAAAIISVLGMPKIGFSILLLSCLFWFNPSHRFKNNHTKNQ